MEKRWIALGRSRKTPISHHSKLTATDRRLSDYSSLGKDGLTVTLGRSKTDQAGAGRKIGIPYGSNPETYPVRTLQAWLVEQARITAGHLRRYGIFQHRSRPDGAF
jgi:hypothetical protein